METVHAWLSLPSNQGFLDLIVFNVFTPQDEEAYLAWTPAVFTEKVGGEGGEEE